MATVYQGRNDAQIRDDQLLELLDELKYVRVLRAEREEIEALVWAAVDDPTMPMRGLRNIVMTLITSESNARAAQQRRLANVAAEAQRLRGR